MNNARNAVLMLSLLALICAARADAQTGPIVTTPTGTPVAIVSQTATRTYVSAGTGQFALSVTTNTQLTVPTGTVCAYITVESASIRRTSDGTSASASNGTLLVGGTQWTDCGPLAAYKFTAVSGSPTLDVEYFK